MQAIHYHLSPSQPSLAVTDPGQVSTWRSELWCQLYSLLCPHHSWAPLSGTAARLWGLSCANQGAGSSPAVSVLSPLGMEEWSSGRGLVDTSGSC